MISEAKLRAVFLSFFIHYSESVIACIRNFVTDYVNIDYADMGYIIGYKSWSKNDILLYISFVYYYYLSSFL